MIEQMTEDEVRARLASLDAERAELRALLPRGRPGPRGPHVHLAARNAEWERRYLAGETCAGIAASYDMSAPAVHAALLRRGVAMRPPGRRPGRRPSRSRPERAREWERRFIAGETMADIGRSAGVSREAVRQQMPTWLSGLVRRRAHARKRLRHFEAYHFVCRVCGTDSLAKGRSGYCSKDCYQVWLPLRTHLPGFDEMHRRSVARTNLRRAEDRYTAHARRVLSDAPPPKNRVWLRPGGQADQAARAAYANGWPIFDQLPRAIQDRITGAADPPNATCEHCGKSFAAKPHSASRFCSLTCYRAHGIGR